MNRWVMIIFITFFFPSQSFAVSIDEESLWSRLEFSGSIAQHMESIKIAKQNLSLVEKILFYSDMKRFNGPARFNCLTVLREACEDGLISVDHFFKITFRLYKEIEQISNPKKLKESRNDIFAAWANLYDHPRFPIKKQTSGFSILLSFLSSSGLINDQTFVSWLQNEIATISNSLNENQTEPNKKNAASQISNLISELERKRGTSLSEDTFKILNLYLKNLVENILYKPNLPSGPTSNITPKVQNSSGKPMPVFVPANDYKKNVNFKTGESDQFISIEQWKKMNEKK